MYSIGGAFEEVVCQGLMVVEARKDINLGSEDLQSWAWTWYGIGGTTGCLTAGIILNIWQNGDGARLCYAISALFPLILGISGPFIDKTLEENQTEMVKMKLWPRIKFVFKEVGEGLKIKELYTTLIFQMVLSSVVPSFNTYLYDYMLKVVMLT